MPQLKEEDNTRPFSVYQKSHPQQLEVKTKQNFTGGPLKWPAGTSCCWGVFMFKQTPNIVFQSFKKKTFGVAFVPHVLSSAFLSRRHSVDPAGASQGRGGLRDPLGQRKGWLQGERLQQRSLIWLKQVNGYRGYYALLFLRPQRGKFLRYFS